jgi:hypothetical protein
VMNLGLAKLGKLVIELRYYLGSLFDEMTV